jgi:uncharacterized DUF497 family protein
MRLRFEWDKGKAETNQRKHGISFNEAQLVYTDDLSIIIPDPDHSAEEERLIIIGISRSGHTLVVSYVERDGAIRLISARRATRAERGKYEQTSL